MTATTFIYALKDPLTGVPRYVGKADCPIQRLREHVCEARKMATYKDRWISSILKSGLKPEVELLDEVVCAEWAFWEREWIALYRALGFRIVNATDGGDGIVGHVHSYAAREKMRGPKHTPDSRRRISDAMRGRKLSEETKNKIRAAFVGRPLTPEHRAAVSAGLRGRVLSRETRAKISAARSKKD